jgi:uncharacterized membrane protein YfcA
VRILLASPLGFLIGIALGAVGGGGSILAVPALVYAAGVPPKQATSASLVIVGATALAGLPQQLRAHRVRVGAGLVFAATGVAGSFAGTAVNRGIDPNVLLLAFSGLMVVAATAMFRRQRRASLPVEVTSVGAPAAPNTVRGHVRLQAGSVAKVIAAGTVVGFLTGLFGVGGGFVIVPALVLALGFSMPVAAGTSLLVIACNSMVALAQRLHGQALPWNAILAFGIAAIPGVIVGSRLSRTVEPERLARWFVVLLVGVATYTAVRSSVALLG